MSVSRGTQTNGVYSGGASRTFSNGDGSYSYSHSRVGYDGAARSVGGTVSRP